jgi:signal transduction histidine kinase
MFLAVYFSVRLGTRRSGLLSTGFGALAMLWLLPFSAPVAWLPIAVFTVIAVLATHLIAGRSQALERLQQSEARAIQALADAKTSEAKLRQAQKMEAVGQLVAGVAHNYNNLLTITMGYTEMALEHEGMTDDVRPLLREVQNATERAATLTRQLLAMTRTRDARVALVDVNATLRDLQGLLSPIIREDIQLTIETAPMPLMVSIDLQDLEQVVLNLVLNARDALPDGGSIALGVSRTHVAAADIPAAFTALPGDFVRLTVRDNGTGMSADVQAHLFEPFFTTKHVDQGTGLGLAFTYGVIRNAQGFVTVQTAPGEGTAAMIWLPAEKA